MKTLEMGRTSLVVTFLLLTTSHTANNSVKTQSDLHRAVFNFLNYNNMKESHSGSHLIQVIYGWHLLSVVGMIGTVSNLFLLHCFYTERAVLATSVNAMICMDTLHKVVYSAVIVHWRNYVMIGRYPVFQEWLGNRNVRYLKL